MTQIFVDFLATHVVSNSPLSDLIAFKLKGM